ncbi:hypothetical protein GGS20DRAFT_582780 [Poronia punctata]|nr:hypothetical protein GGS20DRAFT_582780 [Poronia punctata]
MSGPEFYEPFDGVTPSGFVMCRPKAIEPRTQTTFEYMNGFNAPRPQHHPAGDLPRMQFPGSTSVPFNINLVHLDRQQQVRQQQQLWWQQQQEYEQLQRQYQQQQQQQEQYQRQQQIQQIQQIQQQQRQLQQQKQQLQLQQLQQQQQQQQPRR